MNTSLYARGGKRLVDVLVTVVLLVLFAPCLVAIALLVLFLEGRPIIFVQERVGLNGKPFKIYKFRTMHFGKVANCMDLKQAEMYRVTKLGWYLRFTHFDELPQFFNVLRGDMSLVGPRPLPAYFIDLLKSKGAYSSEREKVRPGMIGPAQVRMTDAGHLPYLRARMRMDKIYVSKYCFLYDLSVCIYAVLVFFRRMNSSAVKTKSAV